MRTDALTVAELSDPNLKVSTILLRCDVEDNQEALSLPTGNSQNSKWQLFSNLLVLWTHCIFFKLLQQVVDVGGGTGFCTLGVVKTVKAENVTLIDQSPHQLQKAKEKPALQGVTIVEVGL